MLISFSLRVSQLIDKWVLMCLESFQTFSLQMEHIDLCLTFFGFTKTNIGSCCYAVAFSSLTGTASWFNYFCDSSLSGTKTFFSSICEKTFYSSFCEKESSSYFWENICAYFCETICSSSFCELIFCLKSVRMSKFSKNERFSSYRLLYRSWSSINK